LEATYNTMSGILGASSTHECVTVEGRILNLGFGLFILSFITYFTGTIAASLIVEKQGEVGSVEDAIELRMTICVLQALTPALRAKYPTMKYHVMPSTPSLLDGMEAGECDAALMGRAYFEDRVAASR
jgi:hypothetical protein